MRRAPIAVATLIALAHPALGQPKPVAPDQALVEAIKRGCLPLVLGKQAFAAENSAKLAALGFVLPEGPPPSWVSPDELAPPWQILRFQVDGLQVLVAGDNPDFLCRITTFGAPKASADAVVAFLAADPLWRALAKETWVKSDGTRKRSWYQSGHGGQQLLIQMTTRDDSSPIPASARLTTISVNRTVPGSGQVAR